MPLYKEQGIVLRSAKLAEADKIITVLTQNSGKVRAVAKGVRRTKSRFGARLEPFTHVSLMIYRGRGALDTVAQAEIISSYPAIRRDLGLYAAGETMLEAADKVAEEHERNTRLFMLLLSGLRALDLRPSDPPMAAESFLLKLLSLSGFRPSLADCAICGRPDPELFSSGQGGAVCTSCADYGAGPASASSLAYLEEIANSELTAAGTGAREPRVRAESRALLFGFAEYHLERRMRSLPMLARGLAP